jgi:hypothetical protein
MIYLRTRPVLIAADTKTEGRNGRTYRKLTVVDQQSGHAGELDVDSRLNGELDGLLHRVAVLTVRHDMRWPKEKPENGPNRPYKVTEVVSGRLVDSSTGEVSDAA